MTVKDDGTPRVTPLFDQMLDDRPKFVAYLEELRLHGIVADYAIFDGQIGFRFSDDFHEALRAGPLTAWTWLEEHGDMDRDAARRVVEDAFGVDLGTVH